MISIVCLVLNLFQITLFVTIIMSWFPMQPGGAMASVYSACFRITDPVLGPIRRTVPALRVGGLALDLSPFIVFIAIRILQGLIGC